MKFNKIKNESIIPKKFGIINVWKINLELWTYIRAWPKENFKDIYQFRNKIEILKKQNSETLTHKKQTKFQTLFQYSNLIKSRMNQ